MAMLNKQRVYNHGSVNFIEDATDSKEEFSAFV